LDFLAQVSRLFIGPLVCCRTALNGMSYREAVPPPWYLQKSRGLQKIHKLDFSLRSRKYFFLGSPAWHYLGLSANLRMIRFGVALPWSPSSAPHPASVPTDACLCSGCYHQGESMFDDVVLRKGWGGAWDVGTTVSHFG
jgi:hypothetical protein